MKSNRKIRNDRNSIYFPLFEGMGTHFAYLYVGSPKKQRVSVIVDTGSHHTAFPCTGCNCGVHMNPFFNPGLSSSARVAKCSDQKNKCRFSQSYSEGSSWTAFKVTDQTYMGGETVDAIKDATSLAIPFDFGCHEIEQGLFRTQHVDGIMGFSARVDTMPFQLKKNNITKTKAFSLCFRPKGGRMTLAAPETATSQDKATETVTNLLPIPMSYIPLIKSSGWYTVKLVDILMYVPNYPDQNIHSTYSMFKASNTNNAVSGSFVTQQKNLRGNAQTTVSKLNKETIGEPPAKFNQGKGVIIDSGTTDTFLPKVIKKSFEALFLKLSKLRFGNHKTTLTDMQFNQLPVIVFRFQNKYDSTQFIDVETFPSSYADKFRSSKKGSFDYIFRIYLTEGSGAVLGSNFMNYHNIKFDIENMEVGIQPDTCHFKPPLLNSNKRHLVANENFTNIGEKNQLHSASSIYEHEESFTPLVPAYDELLHDVYSRRRLITTHGTASPTAWEDIDIERMYNSSKHVYGHVFENSDNDYIAASLTTIQSIHSSHNHTHDVSLTAATTNDMTIFSGLRYQQFNITGYDYTVCVLVLIIIMIILCKKMSGGMRMNYRMMSC